MNETLEEMARALFKSWFVDFDPVRAKMEGRQPAGMDDGTAALFPAEFKDSVLGEIPKGWTAGTVGDDFDITMGQSPPGATYNEVGEGLPFYQGRRDFKFRYPIVRVYCSAPKRTAQYGDALVSVRAPVGDVNMAESVCCVGRGVAAVRHKTGSRSYTYYAMRSLKSYFERFESEGTVLEQ
jgi:type I restriction enzyme S subunit